jgi:hypothetical protein
MIRFTITGILVLGACSDNPPSSRQDAQAPQSPSALVATPDTTRPASDSLLIALEQMVLSYGHTRASIVKALGTPALLQQNEARGPNDEADTLVVITYPAIEIILRKSGRDHQEYFSNIRVVDTGLSLPPPLKLFRTSRGDLTRLLGSPADTQLFGDTTVLGYEAPRGPVIQFYFLRNVLWRIRWVYDLG